MALTWNKIWQHGTKKQLVPGYHYKENVASLVVPEGQVVTFYENQDRTGKKSFPLNEGTYHHLEFYGIEHKSGVIHVEENGLSSHDLVEVGWYTVYDKNKKDGIYPMAYSLPIGDRRYGEDFPNDKIEWLLIPFGVTVEVFEDGGYKGGSLIFSGNTQDGMERINLKDYGYTKKVSSIKIRADEWISAGIAIEDESIVSSNSDRTIATTELANNSPHTASISKEIGSAYTEETTEDWSIEAGITASAGFEAGPEVCKVSGSVEVSVSGGYGESKTSAVERSITDIATVEVEGYGNAKASLIIEEGRMEGIAVRKWRNKRNNVIIEQRGRISANRANKARVEIH